MGTIGKIRKRSGLLIILVGGAMAAFILGDFFGSAGNSNTAEVGEINGEVINLVDFDTRVQNELNAIKQANPNLDESQSTQIRNQVWNTMIRENVLMPELDQVGLGICKEELDDIRFGQNILDEFKNDQSFRNPETGQFDPNYLRQYFVYIQDNFPAFSRSQKNRIISNRLNTKYNTLVKKGIAVNSIEAKDDLYNKKHTANVSYVTLKYADIADSTVAVSDSELKSYYEAHKNEAKYEQELNRSAQFIVYDIKASDADKKSIQFELESLKEEFKNTEDDSLFVVTNSDQNFYVAQEYTEGTFAAIDNEIQDAEVGTVFGPFENNGNMMLTKVVFNGKDKEVKASHILLKAEAGQDIEEVKAKADSLMKVAKRKNNFAELAKEFSTDQGSAANGGDLDWFGRGRMVKPFENGAFNTRKGQMTIVESQFGVHLIKVTDTRPVDALRVANISRKIEASNETIDELYNQASEFSINFSDANAFVAGANEKGLNIRTAANILPNSSFVPGLNQAREFVQWMYRAELGTVSEPIELSDKMVVAVVTEINEKGVPSFESVKDQMERALIKEKKAEMLKAKLEGTDLVTIARDNSVSVLKAYDVSFSDVTLESAGREPKVIGAISSMKEGEVSMPLTGELGVYLVKVDAINPVPENADYSTNKSILESNRATAADFAAYGALIEKANIEDNRYKYY